jgi:hypothetical protein
MKYTSNIRPAIPFSLTEKCKLIAWTVVPATDYGTELNNSTNSKILPCTSLPIADKHLLQK